MVSNRQAIAAIFMLPCRYNPTWAQPAGRDSALVEESATHCANGSAGKARFIIKSQKPGRSRSGSRASSVR
jgi:hypothetical protein